MLFWNFFHRQISSLREKRLCFEVGGGGDNAPEATEAAPESSEAPPPAPEALAAQAEEDMNERREKMNETQRSRFERTLDTRFKLAEGAGDREAAELARQKEAVTQMYDSMDGSQKAAILDTLSKVNSLSDFSNALKRYNTEAPTAEEDAALKLALSSPEGSAAIEEPAVRGRVDQILAGLSEGERGAMKQFLVSAEAAEVSNEKKGFSEAEQSAIIDITLQNENPNDLDKFDRAKVLVVLLMKGVDPFDVSAVDLLWSDPDAYFSATADDGSPMNAKLSGMRQIGAFGQLISEYQEDFKKPKRKERPSEDLENQEIATVAPEVREAEMDTKYLDMFSTTLGIPAFSPGESAGDAAAQNRAYADHIVKVLSAEEAQSTYFMYIDDENDLVENEDWGYDDEIFDNFGMSLRNDPRGTILAVSQYIGGVMSNVGNADTQRQLSELYTKSQELEKGFHDDLDEEKKLDTLKWRNEQIARHGLMEVMGVGVSEDTEVSLDQLMDAFDHRQNEECPFYLAADGDLNFSKEWYDYALDAGLVAMPVGWSKARYLAAIFTGGMENTYKENFRSLLEKDATEALTELANFEFASADSLNVSASNIPSIMKAGEVLSQVQGAQAIAMPEEAPTSTDGVPAESPGSEDSNPDTSNEGGSASTPPPPVVA